MDGWMVSGWIDEYRATIAPAAPDVHFKDAEEEHPTRSGSAPAPFIPITIATITTITITT